MSAWIVSKPHIDLLVEAATRDGRDAVSYIDGGEWKQATRANRDEVGQMLVTENVASVSARYPSDNVEGGELPGPCDTYYLGPYTYTDRHYQLTSAEILNAVACYEYQSCEHPGWEESGAASLCKALFRRHAMKFSTGPWGWEEKDLADKPKSVSILDLARGA